MKINESKEEGILFFSLNLVHDVIQEDLKYFFQVQINLIVFAPSIFVLFYS